MNDLNKLIIYNIITICICIFVLGLVGFISNKAYNECYSLNEKLQYPVKSLKELIK